MCLLLSALGCLLYHAVYVAAAVRGLGSCSFPSIFWVVGLKKWGSYLWLVVAEVFWCWKVDSIVVGDGANISQAT